VKKLLGIVMLGLLALAVQASEIVVSWETNGVLVADGLEPGTACAVEWSSNLSKGFTNNPAPFEGLAADSNGMVHVAIPMFFRVIGTPIISIPEGMVLIPAGINSGTNPLGDGESYTINYPETYALTNGLVFFIDATEVTKAQWDEVYNWAVTNDYSFSNVGFGKGTNHPVHTVNWYDCVKWCNARSERSGKPPCYTISNNIYRSGVSTPDCDLNAGGYRLPTSDEWEYAARGGLSGKRFPWGDTTTHSNANYYSSNGDSYDISATRSYHPDYDDDGAPFTSPTGSFEANGYGLYDMSGNLWEWCNDLRPGYEGSRIMRGGCWYETAFNARCGRVSGDAPFGWGNHLGFRSVLPVQ
jgi:formylglycine-generating enzyme required for sulfatase activity